MIELYTEPRFAPAPAPTRRTDWATVAAQLSANPGQWAAVGVSDSARHPLNKRQRALLSLECVTRSNGDGTSTLWVRYVGAPPRRVVPVSSHPPLVWAPPTLNTLIAHLF